jgi:hypothetical protein
MWIYNMVSENTLLIKMKLKYTSCDGIVLIEFLLNHNYIWNILMKLTKLLNLYSSSSNDNIYLINMKFHI